MFRARFMVMMPRWLGKLGILIGMSLVYHMLLDLGFDLIYRDTSFSYTSATWADYVIALLTFSILWESHHCLRNRLEARYSWAHYRVQRFLRHYGGMFLMSLLLFAVVTVLMIVIQFRREGPWRDLLEWPTLQQAFLFILLIGSCQMLALVMIDEGLFLSNQWRQAQLDIERLRKETLEAQFQTLKGQIKPHFLFNSLTTLSRLIAEDQRAAVTFVRQLSTVYRYVLENREHDVISLKEEQTMMTAYLYLMETRFKDQLRLDVRLPEELEMYQLPPLTLQMLIENAIKHNITSKARPLVIAIFVGAPEDPDGPRFLVVQNTLQRKSSREYSSQIGLKNIVARYQLLTDIPVRIEEDVHTFRVTIPLLPVQNGEYA